MFSGKLFLLLLAAAVAASAQQVRITRRIDNLDRTRLPGHLQPRALSENDIGRLAPATKIPFVTVMLGQSAAQRADLEKLLTEQQTPGSANYHRWLTPGEYADRFGASQADVNQIATWLTGQGLTVAAIANGRNWIAVSGTAAQVESAFQTEIHEYTANGETHFANASEPSIPTAILPLVQSIRGLNDFHPKPRKRSPRYTSATSGNHYLAPDDFAAIYDVLPAYKAGIDGTGQKIVIAGQTRVNLSDIQQFRSKYNLPANDPQLVLVPSSRDPGIVNGDLSEADLDLEWAGAVARNAAIIYVYSNDVMESVQYAIDQNLAPVVSLSYGSCELENALSDALAFQSWARQGNAQGVTWINASGDSGGADCNDSRNPGLAVDVPSSIPEVTGMGGTEFQEGATGYWNASNDASGASVLSYVPETAWNDSLADGTPSASGGGASVFFSRPSWQVGPGVPADNARHVPDVAMNASADHDGYLVYTSGKTQVYGGTSAPAPAFAGIAALLNQYLVASGKQSIAGLGNMNPGLYSLAQTAPSVFHDVTTGDNIVTVACSKRAISCTATAVGGSAGAGYDSVTGLGSVDVWNLINGWNAASNRAPAAPTLSLLSNVSALSPTDVAFLTATATGTGSITPVGVVTFAGGGTSLGSVTLLGSGGTATATLAVTGSQLPAGSNTIVASYNSSSLPTSLTSSVTLSASPTASSSSVKPAITGLADGASYQQRYAPGMILSIFGSQLAPTPVVASSLPLPITTSGVAATVNGVSAPLYYVSPTQLNIEIPYETSANGTATITINNNGLVSSRVINMSSAAPGVFADQSRILVPNGSAARGQTISLFLTGVGAVSPAVSTGAAAASSTPLAELPAPVQNTLVTVAGVTATTRFIGIPYGLAGVAQINFDVPSGIPAGLQPVVVTVNGIQSSAVYVNVN